MHGLARPELRECYVQSLAEKLSDWSPASEDTAEECLNHLHYCITCSADGRGLCSNPEWFEESVNVLEPLIQEKNQARLRYLQVGTRSCKQNIQKAPTFGAKGFFKCKEEVDFESGHSRQGNCEGWYN